MNLDQLIVVLYFQRNQCFDFEAVDVKIVVASHMGSQQVSTMFIAVYKFGIMID